MLPSYTSDSTVEHLREAAKSLVEARDKKALAEAGINLASAMQKMGMELWPLFLLEAEKRAIAEVSKGSTRSVTKVSAKTADVPANIALGALSLKRGSAGAIGAGNSTGSSERRHPGIQLVRTPNEGDPNTWFVNPGSGQMRFYGPDGYPAVDIDSDHDHGTGVPHMHIWIPVPGSRPARGLPIFPVPF